MELVIALILGIVVGAGIVIFTYKLNDSKRRPDDEVVNTLKESFGNISLEVIQKSTDQFLKLANETLAKQSELGEKDLDSKKSLIDQSLENMKKELSRVGEVINGFEKDRNEKYGEVSNQLKNVVEMSGKLNETTASLREALSSTKARGQWGERMAEDVLQLAGFIENINYQKQRVIESASSRPDFTFFLPQGLKVNMDVKFPLDNYLKYLEAKSENEKTHHKEQFIRDVKQRVKEVTTRDYINTQDNTLDYVLVFIPNEQVYSFVNENARELLDEAMKNKVILCSPFTLYAVLSVIRQSIENFSLQKTSGEMLSLFGSFYKQWNEFTKSFEKVGKKIEETQEEFFKLTTTRRNQLDRPLRKLEELRKEKGIEESLFLEGEIQED